MAFYLHTHHLFHHHWIVDNHLDDEKAWLVEEVE
jgi:hypothetical protein